MAASPLPVEWIRGGPRDRWFGGSLAAVLAIAIPSSLLYSWLVPIGSVSPVAYSVGAGIGTGLSIYIGLTAYNAIFPPPLPGVGISPKGVIADYGLRREPYPWSRVFLSGDMLLLVSRRLSIVSRFRVTAYQAARLAYLRPRTG